MMDIKRKLHELATQLGMRPAKELTQPVPPTEKVKPDVVTPSDVSRSSDAGNLGVLSPELANHLRKRLGLEKQQEIAYSRGGEAGIETLFPGELIGDKEASFFLYRRDFPLDFTVGCASLGMGLSCKGHHIALSACDKALFSFDSRRTCFVDTETTGLAGGTGTVAFLVGLGYFRDTGFVLEQCFLRDFDDEGPMLDYLSQKFREFTCLVSYNGKSFDLPLLRTRFIQHRLRSPFEDMMHYDLVHAVRRVWKRRLSDCSLANIERTVLGFFREGDIPGYMVPQLWIEFLETRHAHLLEPIFTHHAMDILSLAALAGYLSEYLDKKSELSFSYAEDDISLLRLYVKNKEYSQAVAHAKLFLERSCILDELRQECLFLLGTALKRMEQYEEMHVVLKTLHEEYPESIEGAVELAKYLEHSARDYEGALKVCEETLNAIFEGHSRLNLYGFDTAALRTRIQRLENKLNKRRSVLEQGGECIPDL